MSVFLLCDQVTTSLRVFNDDVSTDSVTSCLYMHCVEDDDIISYEDMEDEEGWFKFYDLDFDIHSYRLDNQNQRIDVKATVSYGSKKIKDLEFHFKYDFGDLFCASSS